MRIPDADGRESELIKLSVVEACNKKWEFGRKRYGPGTFQGDPLAHLYSELIDAINYVDEAKRQGKIDPTSHYDLHSDFFNRACEVRSLWLRSQAGKHGA